MAKIDQAVRRVERELIDFSDSEPYAKVLVYGQNGMEKTRFGASGPKPVILDINEKGTQSVRERPGKVYQARRWEQVVWFYWYLKHGDHKHQTAIIDNLTTMQAVCMRQVLKEAEDRDSTRDPKMATFREWNKLKEMIGPMILDFRNLDMHVVFLAQERTDKGEEGDESRKVPDLSPAVRSIALGSVGIIGRIFRREVRSTDPRTRREVKKWRTLLLVGDHEDYITKDRTFKLGKIVVSPTMTKIIKAWEEMEKE